MSGDKPLRLPHPVVCARSLKNVAFILLMRGK
jgi:hypothetical protein